MKKLAVASVVAALGISLLPAVPRAEEAPAPAASAPPAPSSPGAAQAQPPPAPPAQPQPPPAQPQPRWSFGGGLSYALYSDFALAGPMSLGLSPSSVFLPAVTASLERRLSARGWFVLGLSGSANRSRRDIPDGSYGSARNDARQLLLSAGLRRSLTRAAAPVEVSVVVVAQGGIFDGEQRVENRYNPAAPSIVTQDVTAWFAGARLGIAIDRALADGLTLRVASPLVDGRYERGSARSPGRPDEKQSTITVGAVLAPQLELRLLF
jgi:hypothetical protein